MKEIAKRLKISTSTVSRALKGHPSIGLVTTMRVNKVASELNYVCDQTAVFFKQRKTFTIGVILPDLSDPFYSAALSEIEKYASEKNYNIFVGQSFGNPEKEKHILATMKNHRLDGIIVSKSGATLNYAEFQQMKKYNIPVVFFDRLHAIDELCYSTCSLEAEMLKAIDCLVEEGHRNIAFINGPSELLSSRQRFEAYKKGLSKHDINSSERLVVSSDLSSAQNHQAILELLISDFSKPTAIIAFNDKIVQDAIAIKEKYGLDVRQQISLIGFVNSPEYIWTHNHTQQFGKRLLPGKKAAQTLFQLIDSSELEVPIPPVFSRLLN